MQVNTDYVHLEQSSDLRHKVAMFMQEQRLQSESDTQSLLEVTNEVDQNVRSVRSEIEQERALMSKQLLSKLKEAYSSSSNM